MKTNAIHIIYHPTLKGYSGYSRELDGIKSEGKTIEELYEKIKHLLAVRIQTLKEIGHEKEAQELMDRELIFSED